MAVEIFGLKEFTVQLKRLGVEANDLKRAFAKLAAEAENIAKGFAPVRSRVRKSDRHPPGYMRSKIRGSKNRANSARITVTGTRYHRYVHFGAKTVPSPTPFMFKASEVMSPVAVQEVLRELNAIIGRTF